MKAYRIENTSTNPTIVLIFSLCGGCVLSHSFESMTDDVIVTIVYSVHIVTRFRSMRIII